MAFHVEPRPMKTLALILAALVTVTALAETPAQIAADYRAKAEQATERLNKTLDTEAAKISATLLALGDAAAVEALAEQVKAKQAGEAVTTPVPQAVQLFTAYDAARVKALAPVQQASLRRIEALLASSEGQKTEIVAELSSLRASVTKGLMPMPIVVKWSYHSSFDDPAIATMEIRPDGTWELFILAKKVKEVGAWKRTDKTNAILLSYGGASWEMVINGRKASMNRPDSGVRYLKAVGNQTL